MVTFCYAAKEIWMAGVVAFQVMHTHIAMEDLKQWGQVYVNGVNAVIKANTFNDSRHSITSSLSRYKNIVIRSNEFNAVDRAVTIDDALQTRLFIQSNTMSINYIAGGGTYSYGIRVSDNMWVAGNGAKMTISLNEITTGGLYSIWLENLDMPFLTTHDAYKAVYNNPITMNQTVNGGWMGIRFDNCTNARVTENEVNGNAVHADKVAISFSQTTDALVACNTTDFTYTGLQFVATCDGADIKKNEMNSHYDGLVLGIPTVPSSVGEQVDPNSGYTMGNQFKGHDGAGTFYTAAMHSYDSYAGVQPAGPPIDFWIDNTNGQVTWPTGGNNTNTGGASSKFNLVDPSNPKFNCGNILLKSNNNNNNSAGQIQQKIQISDTYLGIINDSITGDGSTTDCHRYGQKFYVYEKFKKDTVLKNSNIKYVQFFDSASLGNLGKFSAIGQLLFLATDTSQIHNDSLIIAFYLDSADLLNQTIIPQLIVEANKKAVNNIGINKILKHNFAFSANDKYVIDTIAPQCSYSGGTAVIEARVIQRHWNDSMYYDNINICDISLPRHSNIPNDEIDEKIFAYPNPASDVLFLKGTIAGTAIIRDITGRKILVTQIKNTVTQIDIKGISEGIYLLTLYSNNRPVNSIHISIIR